jgi:hypothetical protein
MLLMAVLNFWAYLPLALPGQGLQRVPAVRRRPRRTTTAEPVPVAPATG